MKVSFLLAFALVAMATAPAAQTTFDPATGDGFVAKGDVQFTLGLNNKGLQDPTISFAFSIESTVVSEVSWECTNTNNQKVQDREQTTTTSVQGVLSSTARERNQITGFFLEGFRGEATTSSTTDGNSLNSCPSGPWTLTTPAGDPEVVSSTGGLVVNGTLLLTKP